MVAIESASHMPDPVAFVRECHRVSKVGGRVVIAAWLAAAIAGAVVHPLALELGDERLRIEMRKQARKLSMEK